MTAIKGRRRGSFLVKNIQFASTLTALGLFAPGAARAEGDLLAETLSGGVGALAGASIVLAIMGVVTWAILTSRRLEGSSLFNRLFVVVAVTSGFFSAVSSAIGFSLITSQETVDFFRNFVLPPAFGVFVFFLAVAIWVGGAELVRHRDWFRGVRRGFVADILFFIERCLKIFVVIPVLATILFFVSTWTTVVGIGGVDAVRYTYNSELQRLQAECSGITAYRQRDFLFLEDLHLAIGDARRAAEAERNRGAQTGAVGSGPVSDYFDGVAAWLAGLEGSVNAIITGDDPSGADPYDPEICAATIDGMKQLLSANAYDNYDAWAREFETRFDDFVSVLNRWRHDRRIERLLEQQLASFDRANPMRALSAPQSRVVGRYSEDVKSALESLLRKQKLAKPPIPIESAAEASPERGLEIFTAMFETEEQKAEEEEKRVSRTASVVAEEFVPGLSTITPRDAVLKNASIFSDVWALAIAWDYAAYILMLAFLFFPSAERAAGFKD
ncbi:MAG: hypothetical protein R3C55_02905 [Parvularculaceae bacterium]